MIKINFILFLYFIYLMADDCQSADDCESDRPYKLNKSSSYKRDTGITPEMCEKEIKKLYEKTAKCEDCKDNIYNYTIRNLEVVDYDEVDAITVFAAIPKYILETKISEKDRDLRDDINIHACLYYKRKISLYFVPTGYIGFKVCTVNELEDKFIDYNFQLLLCSWNKESFKVDAPLDYCNKPEFTEIEKIECNKQMEESKLHNKDVGIALFGVYYTVGMENKKKYVNNYKDYIKEKIILHDNCYHYGSTIQSYCSKAYKKKDNIDNDTSDNSVP